MAIEKDTTFLTTTNFSLILITTSLVLWFTHWYLSRKHLVKLAQKLPGPPGLPIIGNAWDLRGDSPDIFSAFDKFSKQHRDLFRLWLGPRLLVFLKKPEDIELILSSNVHLDKSPEYNALRPWLGNGLLTSTGDIWRAHRKLIAPTFHINILKSFVDLMNKNSQITVEKLKQFGTETFDCHEYMCEATVDILMETVMGVRDATEPNESLNYASSVMKLNDILHLRHMKPWLKPQLLFDLTEHSKKQFNFLGIVHGLRNKIMNYKQNEYKNFKVDASATKMKEEQEKEEKTNGSIPNGKSGRYVEDLDLQDFSGSKKRKPFLDSLMESMKIGKDISEKEVREQIDTILFEVRLTKPVSHHIFAEHASKEIFSGVDIIARELVAIWGHDTTGAGSSFFLTLMGIYQDVQDKIMEELYDIFGNSDRLPTFADTNEMKFLERCILETFRLYPPVPIIARELQQDLKLASGDYTIPAGCTVVIATYWLHHDPDIFPDPYKFNPDHHLPEASAGRNPYAYIPFSAGPRSCVGRKYAMLKLKILLSTILRNYRIVCQDKESDFRLQADIILKRVEGFKIRLEPRKTLISTRC